MKLIEDPNEEIEDIYPIKLYLTVKPQAYFEKTGNTFNESNHIL